MILDLVQLNVDIVLQWTILRKFCCVVSCLHYCRCCCCIFDRCILLIICGTTSLHLVPSWCRFTDGGLRIISGIVKRCCCCIFDCCLSLYPAYILNSHVISTTAPTTTFRWQQSFMPLDIGLHFVHPITLLMVLSNLCSIQFKGCCESIWLKLQMRQP